MDGKDDKNVLGAQGAAAVATACPLVPAATASHAAPLTDWLVWSYEHNAWWGPDHGGYYTELRAAGLYTEAEAKQIEADANRGCRYRNEEARHITTQADAIMYALPRYQRLAEVLAASQHANGNLVSSSEIGSVPSAAPKEPS